MQTINQDELIEDLTLAASVYTTLLNDNHRQNIEFHLGVLIDANLTIALLNHPDIKDTRSYKRSPKEMLREVLQECQIVLGDRPGKPMLPAKPKQVALILGWDVQKFKRLAS
jgi:hypothetical protein